MRGEWKRGVGSVVLLSKTSDETGSCCFYVNFTAVFGIGKGNFKVTVSFFTFTDSLKHSILIGVLRRTFV